ncbi:response regulator transcription factor [Streptomyces liangshanensis]|uniref:Response regulator transcription factor n=1 Tax=Streptomyces liangshanensis TaxID=2717324 RepID=A0A6G9H074_9ACTN|nr:response regulator transcription factor [Streptomyces liangshanensis]QIQ03928.1 response regulator transcription factor [Streptomyces liangshanensis]
MRFLGVDPEEEGLYRVLLRRGADRQESLACLLDRDAESVASVCDHLTELGLVRAGTGGALHPVSPVKAVESLVMSELDRRRKTLEETVAESGVIDSLLAERDTPVGTPSKQGDLIQHLEGTEAVRSAIDELSFFTWTERLATVPRGVLSEAHIAQARPLDERVLRRGVHMRTLLGEAALKDDTTLGYARELIDKGAQIRVSRNPIERLLICDRSAALAPTDPSHTAKGAILIRNQGLVVALVSLFERMWDAAQELPSSEETSYEGTDLVNSLERKVLQSLYSADKDEIGARDLGISVRTYRKHVATLMRRLDASNRFQVALRARERGWV